MHSPGGFPPRECGGLSVIGHVIPGWSEGLDPESRDSGFTLRVPRNDEDVMPGLVPGIHVFLLRRDAKT